MSIGQLDRLQCVTEATIAEKLVVSVTRSSKYSLLLCLSVALTVFLIAADNIEVARVGRAKQLLLHASEHKHGTSGGNNRSSPPHSHEGVDGRVHGLSVNFHMSFVFPEGKSALDEASSENVAGIVAATHFCFQDVVFTVDRRNKSQSAPSILDHPDNPDSVPPAEFAAWRNFSRSLRHVLSAAVNTTAEFCDPSGKPPLGRIELIDRNRWHETARDAYGIAIDDIVGRQRLFKTGLQTLAGGGPGPLRLTIP
jgi:hypothetical protein